MPIPPSLSRPFAILVLACAACASQPPKAPEKAAQETREAPSKAAAKETPLSKAQQNLSAGVGSYENGAYKVAARQLQAALDAGLEAKGEQARAHKYLAFIHCASGQKRACRDEFRKAFDADPGFDLEPAEAGHPIWGPVFRDVKAGPAAKQKSR